MARRAMLPLFFLALLLASSVAQAVRIENEEVFASTRSGTVTWKTASPLDINSLTVNATHVSLDAYAVDYYPRLLSNLVVTVTTWSSASKGWLVTATSSDTPDFTIANPGAGQYLLKVDGLTLAQCLSTQDTCRARLPSGTSWTVLLIESDVTIPGGGGGAPPSGGTSSPNIADVLPPIPGPFAVFRQFRDAEWLAFGVGLYLVLNHFPRTRAILPGKIPSNQYTFFAGTVLLVILYLSAASAS